MTKTVIDLYSLRRIEVSDTARECSVCGVYKEVRDGEFSDFGGGFVDRANCRACYRLTPEVFKKTYEETTTRKISEEYLAAVREEKKHGENLSRSVSVEDMMDALSKLPPNARLFFGQDGYFADGEHAHIQMPGAPEVRHGIPFYCLGRFSQKY